MKFALFLCLLGFVACSSVRQTPLQSDISADDHRDISALIATETSEPILWMYRDDDDLKLIHVGTGYSMKTFNSSGRSFIVSKSKAGWAVIFRSTWDS
jgi:hypothetical protein